MTKILIVVALVLMVGLTAFGQTAATSSIKISVGPEGGVPTGDFNTGYSFGIGGTASVGYAIDPNFSASLKGGYLSFSGKDVSGFTAPTLSIIPILAGLHYYFMPPSDMRVYGAAEGGLYIASVSGGNSSSKFGVAPTLGAEFKAGENMNIDIHGNYTTVFSDPSSTSWIGFGAGLVFVLQ